MSMKKTKNDHDTMIFSALYLNDQNELWDVGHSVGKIYAM